MEIAPVGAGLISITTNTLNTVHKISKTELNANTTGLALRNATSEESGTMTVTKVDEYHYTIQLSSLSTSSENLAAYQVKTNTDPEVFLTTNITVSLALNEESNSIVGVTATDGVMDNKIIYLTVAPDSRESVKNTADFDVIIAAEGYETTTFNFKVV